LTFCFCCFIFSAALFLSFLSNVSSKWNSLTLFLGGIVGFFLLCHGVVSSLTSTAGRSRLPQRRSPHLNNPNPLTITAPETKSLDELAKSCNFIIRSIGYIFGDIGPRLI
jgi:hypothetical protein